MKAGIIRYMQTEDMCPGTANFKVMREKTCAIETLRMRSLRSAGGRSWFKRTRFSNII